jgi:hypothetical protein
LSERRDTQDSKRFFFREKEEKSFVRFGSMLPQLAKPMIPFPRNHQVRRDSSGGEPWRAQRCA